MLTFDTSTTRWLGSCAPGRPVQTKNDRDMVGRGCGGGRKGWMFGRRKMKEEEMQVRSKHRR